MQQSMTGFGRDERTSQKFLIKAEVRTLNSKFLDFSPRMPKELSFKEAEIRNIVSDLLKRGKIMLTVDLELAGDDFQSAHVDEKLFKVYFDKFSELSESVNGSKDDLVKLAIQAPDVIKQEELSPDELPWKDIKATIEEALRQCINFRKNEGEALVNKLNEYTGSIKNGLEAVEAADGNRAETIRGRLQKGLDDIRERVQVDENRFEQELIFYLERLDISEEKVRLQQHLDYFDEIIKNEEAAGKKLGFIAQEIGREINTIGSKANDADIQRTVVSMKDELEKIKEQVLNLL